MAGQYRYFYKGEFDDLVAAKQIQPWYKNRDIAYYWAQNNYAEVALNYQGLQEN